MKNLSGSAAVGLKRRLPHQRQRGIQNSEDDGGCRVESRMLLIVEHFFIGPRALLETPPFGWRVMIVHVD